jgi:hypothetical protein
MATDTSRSPDPEILGDAPNLARHVHCTAPAKSRAGPGAVPRIAWDFLSLRRELYPDARAFNPSTASGNTAVVEDHQPAPEHSGSASGAALTLLA